jgi:hypothetical protein
VVGRGWGKEEWEGREVCAKGSIESLEIMGLFCCDLLITTYTWILRFYCIDND